MTLATYERGRAHLRRFRHRHVSHAASLAGTSAFNAAASLKADILPPQARDMAAFDAGGNLTGVTHHPDHGSNSSAVVYTDRIAESGTVPSTGTVGDSYDTAMAEAINVFYKSELI